MQLAKIIKTSTSDSSFLAVPIRSWLSLQSPKSSSVRADEPEVNAISTANVNGPEVLAGLPTCVQDLAVTLERLVREAGLEGQPHRRRVHRGYEERLHELPAGHVRREPNLAFDV